MTVYEELLHTYADALLSHQVKGAGPMLDGGFLCRADARFARQGYGGREDLLPHPRL